MNEGRKDKLPKPQMKKARGKKGKNTPPQPELVSNSRSQSSETAIESIRDYPSDG